MLRGLDERIESRSLGYAHWPELSALEAAKVP